MPTNENEEFEFRLRAERERSAAPKPAPSGPLADQIPGNKPIPAPTGKDEGVTLKGLGETGLALGAGVLSTAPKLLGDVGEAMSDVGSRFGIAQKQTGPNILQRGASEINRLAAPSSESGQNIMRGIGDAVSASKLEGLGPMAQEFGPALGSTGRLPVPGAPNMPKVPGVARAGEFVRDLRGKDAAAARGEAQGATREVLSDISKTRGAEQAAASGEANILADLQTRIQRDLDAAAARNGRPTPEQLGTTVRTGFNGAMEAAEKSRESVAGPMYRAAEEAAATREAAGGRVDITPAVKGMEELSTLAENIPELKAKLETLLTSVKGKPKTPAAPPVKPAGHSYTSEWENPPPVTAPVAEPTGLTYKELSLASRYIRDAAYKADLEGYKATFGRSARELAAKLDEQIAKFVPEHTAAAAKYREMSEPMDSLATRLGKAMSSTEGGLGGEAYSKVAAEKLPDRVFGTAEGRNLMVDALAGGKSGAKTTTKALRAKAQAQVDQMVEEWVVERARGKTNKVGAEASAAIPSPGIAPRAEAQFAREAEKQRMLSEAKVGETSARKTADIAEQAKAKIDHAMKQADIDYQYGSKKAAYDGYVKALRQSMAASDPAAYKAAIELINKAGTLEERTKKVRSLATKIIVFAGLPTIGVTIGRHTL